MKKAVLIFGLLFGILLSGDFYAQSGGKRREHRNQRRASMHLFRGRSQGNADKFAKGTGNAGFFARLFKRDRPAWVYHATKIDRKHKSESRNLFSRYHTKGKKYRSGILAKQNSDRSRRRDRGNRSFSRKKYKS